MSRDGQAAGEVPDTPTPRFHPAWRLFWVVVAVVVVWAAFVFRNEVEAWLTGFGSPEEFRDRVEDLGALGPVVFVLAQAIQVIVVPIPGTLFPTVGALAFGPWPALILSLVGLALGSAVVFLAVRRWGRPLAIRWLGEARIARYQTLMTARGGLLIWLLFLLPFLPDDAACALAGLSGLAFRRFMVIATVGRIPAVAAGVFTMAGLERAPAWVWVAAVVGFAGLVWAGIRWGPVLEDRLTRHVDPGPDDED
jgi:uncharacterized membrane protein YdjX (TVP38/TMEM64 family)